MKTPEVLDPERALGETIAAAITVHVDLDGRRKMVVQTFVPRDAPLAEYNSVLDRVTRAIDRQEARYDLRALQDKLKVDSRSLLQMREDYRNIGLKATLDWKASGKRGDPKVSASEASTKLVAEQNIRRYESEIEKTTADIIKCKAEIEAMNQDE